MKPPQKDKRRALGFAGYSGSGKTTLIESIIPLLKQSGLVVSLIKHAHHHFDIDTPGKDSWRHREAGCTEVLVSSARRWVLMHELRGDPEPSLTEQIEWLSPCDLVLVEGYKKADIPKIEVHRSTHARPLLYPEDTNIIAIACDTEIPTPPTLPRLDLNQPSMIAAFIINQLDALQWSPPLKP